MLLLCTRMYPYVTRMHSYAPRMYSYVTCISLVCIRMSLLYVLVGTRMYTYVTRMYSCGVLVTNIFFFFFSRGKARHEINHR